MQVTCTMQNRTMTIALMGEIDHHSAKKTMEKMEAQLEAELPRRVVLDLSGITFSDSSGIALLLRVFRRMEALGGSMTVKNVPAQSQRVFKAAGLTNIIQFC